MARLIDADDLLFELGLDNEAEPDGYKMDLMRSDIKAAIDDAPTVDAVEVVRCKDCAGKKACDLWGCYLDDDDFCSHGV